MASSSFTRRAKLIDGKYVREYRTTDGQLRTEVLEDDTIGGVSSAASTEYVVEDMTSKIVPGEATYTTDYAFNASSLCVYYNGINITHGITTSGNNSFVLISDYADIISSGEGLMAVYFKAS